MSGAMTALRLAETSLFARVALVDIVPGLAAGLALDMWHSASLRGFTTRIEGGAELSAIAGADYIVVTAGTAATAGHEPHGSDRGQCGDHHGGCRRHSPARAFQRSSWW